MRPPTACVACRTRRRKCTAPGHGFACFHCVSKNARCSLGSPSPASNGTVAKVDASQQETAGVPAIVPLPPQVICEEVVDLYFRFIHDTFHSLFHGPMFKLGVVHGNVQPILLHAIIGLAARFSTNSYFDGTSPRTRGSPYAREAARLLEIGDVSLTTVQACVLLGACRIVDGDANAEAVYYSIACRMAMLIDIPNMPVRNELDREINIRVWWSLCMIDVWSSAGVRLPRSIIPRDDVPMPMEETQFLALRPEDRPARRHSYISEPSHSLLAQMIKLNTILVEINAANQLAAFSEEMFGTRDETVIDNLTSKLDDWHSNLPDEIRDTSANLNYWASQGLGNVFVAVYLGYYHFGQLLYYQYLHEDSRDESDAYYTSNTREYAAKCKAHSINLCEILYRAYAKPGCEVLYTMVGHVLVIASTVQLQILLFTSDEVLLCAARSRLERNFNILTRLQRLWPTLDVCFSRFREFHKVCLKSKETSFRMDRWMLRFLFEFAQPIDEQEREDANVGDVTPLGDGSAGMWSMQSLGFSPYY